MHFHEYQRDAKRTDQFPMTAGENSANDPLLVPLLGLAGEAGELLSEFKKYFITGDDRSHFTSVVKEELGDVLWYVSNIASRFGLKLDDIAVDNLQKTEGRWPAATEAASLPMASFLFDARFPPDEQLPRHVVLWLRDAVDDEGQKVMRMSFAEDGAEAGNVLTDNAYREDGYRFHDAFHLAYAAVLGWSPVLRKLWDKKRKSQKLIDEVEDGGRAAVIEEGIAALVFADASERDFYANSDTVDSRVLRTIKAMTAHLEVSLCSYKDWQNAILQGYEVFRKLTEAGGGYVTVDMEARKLTYSSELPSKPSEPE